MLSLESLLHKVEQYQPGANSDLLRRAYEFSARAHSNQLRRSGDPYFYHPVEVANILAEMKLDVVCIAAGLLHDVVEDTLTTIDVIREEFGDDVARIVDGVTKIGKIPFASRHEKQAENFRKMLLAMVDDIRVILVKLADRLHNMRTLQYLPPEKRETIARETLEIYAPIAHRLGMSKIRSELEDLAFSFLDPQSYQHIVELVEKRRQGSEELIAEVKKVLEKKLKEHGIEATIESRIKRIYSIYQKMRRQGITIDQVYDLVAIRVITNTVKDCYSALGIVHNTWKPIPGRIKDYIAMPRPNMYQSLHTSVIGPSGQPFEVQIRTYDMHRIAEEGIAAHWKYKEGKTTKDLDDQRFVWLRHILEWHKDVKDPQQFLSNLKIDLYPEEVYTFTPKGDVIILPRGATPVDFAYAIHTEVGHHCVGAKVNGRIVPLKYKLHNGEIVEILTSKDHEPSRDWLGFVKTSKARNKIRQYLNAKQRQMAIDIGKKLLEKEAKKLKINLKKYLTDEAVAKAIKDFNLKSFDDIYPEIGYGKVSAQQVLAKILPADVLSGKSEQKESALAAAMRSVFGRSDSPIKVKGHDDLLVYRAKCCNPIPGEEIIGYITRGRGISVHSLNCPNVEGSLHNPERKIEVQWAGYNNSDIYAVRISVLTEDRRGMLADITSVIANTKTNIRDVKARAVEGKGIIDLTLDISDIKHLQRIIQLVKEIDGVHEVERVQRAT